MEQNNSEGKYIITLTDDVTITGTIGKDFKKDNLIIEREYETEGEYRKLQYVSTIAIIVLMPILPIMFIYVLLIIIFIILSILVINLTILIQIINLIIELIMFLVELYNTKTAKK